MRGFGSAGESWCFGSGRLSFLLAQAQGSLSDILLGGFFCGGRFFEPGLVVSGMLELVAGSLTQLTLLVD